MKSTLYLGKTYRLTIGGVGNFAKSFLANSTGKALAASHPTLFNDLKKGTNVMLRIGDLRSEGTTIHYQDAFRVLKICYLLTEQSGLLTGRYKSMLRESIWIFADCAPLLLRIACVPPFPELSADLQKIPVVAKHYPMIQAKANLDLEAHLLSLADALELLSAIREVRGFKVVLLRHSLEEATLTVRTALENIR